MSLTPDQAQELRSAINSAFNLSTLRQLLFYHLGKDLQDYGVGNQRDVVLSLIQGMEAEGWTADFIRAAREENPGNPDLQAFAAKYRNQQGE